MDRPPRRQLRTRSDIRRRRRPHRTTTKPLHVDDELIEAIVRELNIAVDEHTQLMKERWKMSFYGVAK